jgi:hypothetical protein
VRANASRQSPLDFGIMQRQDGANGSQSCPNAVQELL